MSEANAPEGLPVESGDSGSAALVLPIPPGGPVIDDTAFVDGLTTRIGHTMSGGYTSWSALFETSSDAQRAFTFIAEQHEADAGWGLEPLTPDVELAEDAVQYAGPYGPWDDAGLYFWREGNLLLAAIGVGDFQADVCGRSPKAWMAAPIDHSSPPGGSRREARPYPPPELAGREGSSG